MDFSNFLHRRGDDSGGYAVDRPDSGASLGSRASGTPFKAELEQDVVINGKVLLRAGTPVIGVVEASLGTRPVSSSLKVNLKSISINGQSVKVRTTGAYGLERFKTKRGVSVSGRDWNFPYKTRIAFQLAQPVNL